MSLVLYHHTLYFFQFINGYYAEFPGNSSTKVLWEMLMFSNASYSEIVYGLF